MMEGENEEIVNVDMEGEERKKKKKKRRRNKRTHDKPKPSDDKSIEKLGPSSKESGGLVQASCFSTLFPQYRGTYIQEIWPVVKGALKEYGISCQLNPVEGSMTVSTTRKTRDPYIIVKARDLIKLLSRSVPAPQAIKILDDEMQCDIIKIGGLVGDKDRFVKRRQQLLGSNSSTLKAIEILTNCYVLVQGYTVAVMGSSKGLKQVRKIVEDCIQNKKHPISHIQTLVVRRELERIPDCTPKFKKKNIKQKKVKSKKKKPYTPFLPPQQPSKVDLELESGNYFLSEKKKSSKKWQEKQELAEKAAEKMRKREAEFLPPEEPTKLNANNSEDGNNVTVVKSLKRKAKDLGKAVEDVGAENYIAAPTEPSKKKKSRRS